jgi:hypothetical protein
VLLDWNSNNNDDTDSEIVTRTHILSEESVPNVSYADWRHTTCAQNDFPYVSRNEWASIVKMSLRFSETRTCAVQFGLYSASKFAPCNFTQITSPDIRF